MKTPQPVLPYLSIAACGESKQRGEIAGLEKPKDQVVPQQDDSDSSDSGTCTNVIISDRYAITAAHCFETQA